MFHGPSGVGKTFLLKWWREQLVDRPQRDKAMWFDLPSLLKAFQSAHHDRRVEELQQELTQDKPLVLDELHRIAGKPKLQQFVLAVLRAREPHRSPTVLASRWHPSEVRDLDPMLSSSLLAGFVAAIDRPGPIGRAALPACARGHAVAQRPRQPRRGAGAAGAGHVPRIAGRLGDVRAAAACRRSTSN